MRAPGYAARRSGVRRIDLRRAITNDFPLKAAALAISVLAFVAVAETTQDAQASFHVAVERPADVPDGYVLRGTFGEVTVKLRGPQAQVAKIAQTDLHPAPDLAQADLARNDEQNVPIRVAVPDSAVTVQIDPATMALRLEKIVSRSLPVQVRFANDPPRGFQPGTPALSAAEARISGPQSGVANVAGVFATLRFGDTPIDISTSADAVAVDAAGMPVDGVQSDPPTVQVNVPVLSTTSTRTVPVLWSLKGNVAAGFWISRITTDPIAVQLQGPPDKLAAIDRVDTAAIDVTGLTANGSFRVPLLLPDGIALLQPADAVVGVTVIALTGTRPFPVVAVQVTGVAAGLVADAEPATVGVLVSGPAATLVALGTDAVTASVDATGKGAGTFTADVVLKVPAGVTVLTLQPARVTVTMRSR